MKAQFWDVKEQKKVTAEVTEVQTYKNGRAAYKALTKDGRSLTRFISKADADAFQGKKTCCKKGCKK